MFRQEWCCCNVSGVRPRLTHHFAGASGGFESCMPGRAAVLCCIVSLASSDAYVGQASRAANYICQRTLSTRSVSPKLSQGRGVSSRLGAAVSCSRRRVLEEPQSPGLPGAEEPWMRPRQSAARHVPVVSGHDALVGSRGTQNIASRGTLPAHPRALLQEPDQPDGLVGGEGQWRKEGQRRGRGAQTSTPSVCVPRKWSLSASCGQEQQLWQLDLVKLSPDWAANWASKSKVVVSSRICCGVPSGPVHIVCRRPLILGRRQQPTLFCCVDCSLSSHAAWTRTSHETRIGQ
jgi:hypothetical protein